jgi:hypothetical protein
VFGSFLIAYLILNVYPLKKIFLPDNPKGLKYIGNILGYYLIISSLILPIYLSFYYPDEYKKSFGKITSTVKEASQFITQETKSLYFLTTPSIFHTFYLNDIMKFQTNDGIEVYPLSSFSGNLKIKKLDDHSFLLETTSKGWLNNLFAKIARVYPKLEVGKKYYLKNFSATILKTTLDGSDLLSAKFDFKAPLNDSTNLFVYHDGMKIIKLNPDTLSFNNWYLLRKEVKSF